MNTYIVSFEHGPHMSDQMEVDAISKEAAWVHAVSFSGYNYITKNWVELKLVVDANNAINKEEAIEASKEEFEKEFKAMLVKYNATARIDKDDGGHFTLDGSRPSLEVCLDGETFFNIDVEE